MMQNRSGKPFYFESSKIIFVGVVDAVAVVELKPKPPPKPLYL